MGDETLTQIAKEVPATL
ncbi:hypothetical protein Goari_003171, partial [Gossypium aridum]|nr:hypothetical protein [Gossypium aridum]